MARGNESGGCLRPPKIPSSIEFVLPSILDRLSRNSAFCKSPVGDIHLRGPGHRKLLYKVFGQEGNNLIRFLFGPALQIQVFESFCRPGRPGTLVETFHEAPRSAKMPNGVTPAHTVGPSIPWICLGEGYPDRMSRDRFAESEKNRGQNQGRFFAQIHMAGVQLNGYP